MNKEVEVIIQLFLREESLENKNFMLFGKELNYQEVVNQESIGLIIKIGELILAVRLDCDHINSVTYVR